VTWARGDPFGTGGDGVAVAAGVGAGVATGLGVATGSARRGAALAAACGVDGSATGGGVDCLA
jgi:hypothetical protein